ncbi:universal stress protein [Halovivax limisalsi]|uniref:universal stress protein n=1 Tax=Halovivax limisalsi TaxID=1453760 RepID=UPI001FFCC836|nr:universal stress protein [Halovivax limisalsi]
MVDRLLVPYDGSAAAAEALRYAFETFPDATVEVLYVVEPFAAHTDAGSDDARREWRDRAAAIAGERFDEARAIAAEYDAAIETEWRYGRPGHEIVDRVAADDVDQVVMGCHGRSGIERLMLGSVAETTIRRSEVPVTVIPEA